MQSSESFLEASFTRGKALGDYMYLIGKRKKNSLVGALVSFFFWPFRQIYLYSIEGTSVAPFKHYFSTGSPSLLWLTPHKETITVSTNPVITAARLLDAAISILLCPAYIVQVSRWDVSFSLWRRYLFYPLHCRHGGQIFLCGRAIFWIPLTRLSTGNLPVICREYGI